MGEWNARRPLVVTGLGIAQILGWGTSFYFPAVMAGPIVRETGWSLGMVVSGTTLGLLVAGLISPAVGAIIARRGGRPVLAASSVLFSLGLLGIGLAPTLPVYLAAWIVVGLAMGSGLYDAAFAGLARAYGAEARSQITTLTLFGGFSSTICWPLSAVLIENFGWREACFTYAALHLFVGLPLQLLLPTRIATALDTLPGDRAALDAKPLPREPLVLTLLATVMTIAAGIGAVIVVHLLIILQARGASATFAVALGTLFGPAQVAARVVERLFGDRYHPIWTAFAATVLMALGLAVFELSPALLAVAVIVYAAGYGITWVARGTLPLAILGPSRYPQLMGRLAFPSLIAQALAPSAGALLMEQHGTDATLATLIALALCNVALVAWLWRLCRVQRGKD